MKTNELISIIKKYIDDEVRLIIRSEIKLAFKELQTEGVQPKKIIPQQSKTLSVPQKKSFTENVVKQPITKQYPKVKPPIRTGNPAFDNILLQTKQEMLGNPQNNEPEIEENIIESFMTKKPVSIPAGRTISMTTDDITMNEDSYDYNGQDTFEQEDIPTDINIPSVDDFINMKRQ